MGGGDVIFLIAGKVPPLPPLYKTVWPPLRTPFAFPSNKEEEKKMFKHKKGKSKFMLCPLPSISYIPPLIVIIAEFGSTVSMLATGGEGALTSERRTSNLTDMTTLTSNNLQEAGLDGQGPEVNLQVRSRIHFEA